MGIAAKRFVVEVGFAPSDGGLYLLAQVYVGLASVKQFDPDMQAFIQYVQFFQSGTSNGQGKEMVLGGQQRFARVISAFKKVSSISFAYNLKVHGSPMQGALHAGCTGLCTSPRVTICVPYRSLSN